MTQPVNRTIFWIPLSLLFLAAIGIAGCALSGQPVHPRTVFAAALICLVTSEMALIPLRLVRGSDQLATSQAALIGTVVQMIATLIVGGALLLARVGFGMDLAFWLVAFYFISLVVVVIQMVGAVRNAPAVALPGKT